MVGGLILLGFNGVERGGGDGKSRGGETCEVASGEEDSRSVSRADLSPVIALSIVAWTYC